MLGQDKTRSGGNSSCAPNLVRRCHPIADFLFPHNQRQSLMMNIHHKKRERCDARIFLKMNYLYMYQMIRGILLFPRETKREEPLVRQYCYCFLMESLPSSPTERDDDAVGSSLPEQTHIIIIIITHIMLPENTFME